MEDTNLLSLGSVTPENITQAEERDKTIIKTSIIGIGANLALAAFKAFVGIISNSIAITLDAVNNVSDASSSLITIIGTKLAAKQPNKKHPWGHGRVEYLTALVIAMIILYAGFTSLIESIKKIITPDTPNYGAATIVVVSVGIVVKIVLGSYVKSVGNRVNSDSLINSGQDALNDSIITAATLVAAIVYIFTKVRLEAVLAAIISVIILKSGFDMLSGTLSEILGERISFETATEVTNIVNSFDEVLGAYDLVLHDYGPNKLNGSVHIEISNTMKVDEVDLLIRKITAEVYAKTGIILTAIGIYSHNDTDKNIMQIRTKISEIVGKYESIIQMHGFYISEEPKLIRFDLVISFDEPDRQGVFRQAVVDVQAAFPDYKILPALDTDFSLTE